jgi:isoleucyl-tRNA synthetase
MYHIVEALVRWLAPILSFTSEEIWRHIPGNRAESVFLSTWYEGLFGLNEHAVFSRADWARLIEMRDAVAKQLEARRNVGEIGSSLDAQVTLYCDGSIFDMLQQLNDELRFLLITSYARVLPLGQRPNDAVEAKLNSSEMLYIKAAAAPYSKCVRCWHRREDVGEHSEHPELCGRCFSNIAGSGETRKYA